MHTLRARLIAAFVVATLVPLAASIWIAMSLLDRSLGYANAGELDRLSRTLEDAAKAFYQRERETLQREAASGALTPSLYASADVTIWPEPLRAFYYDGAAERFALSGDGGDHLDYMRRTDVGIEVFTRDLGGVRMEEIASEFRRTRALVGDVEGRDLRRGFTLTLLLLVGAVWLLSLAPIVFLAHRISTPVRELTAGLTDFAAGRMDRRLPVRSADEVGRAGEAFNHMAAQLERSRERLVYLTQVASWQSLARKMAHELKNSLTPIRLTVEEIVARQPADPAQRAFMQQAAQIVVSEVEALERRVRAFSEFSSEPAVTLQPLDLNALARERIALLAAAHPHTAYEMRLAEGLPPVRAGADQVNGILTNLLENAADAAGPGGTVLVVTAADASVVRVDVHDSGPGVSAAARQTLFAPTITFKKDGMGLGLSIARKHALVCGGDLELARGVLSGACFRLTLPAAVAEALS